MSGPGDPPDGTPEGAPSGGDDEYRSVVFDESFVKAARIQEFSAEERLEGAARAVRIRHVLPRGLARQAVALILLIVLAFGFAIYMGVRHPYKTAPPPLGEPLRATVIPLAPTGKVAAVPVASPFAGSPAAHYRVGAEGIVNPPGVHQEGGFAESEVMRALDIVREYLTDSALNPRAVADGDVSAVRNLLNPGQVDQFDASLTKPATDGEHEATGWLVRFDPAARVSVAPGGIRVQGTLTPAETSDDQLEIASDHTFVYALRGPGDSALSLFTVRRALRFRFDHQDIQQHHVQVVQADVAAGPLACGSAVQSAFRPILAGGRAPGGAPGADPYDQEQPVGAVCALLDTGAPGAGTAGRSAPTAGSPADTTATAGSVTETAATPATGPGRTPTAAATAATRDPATPLTYPPLPPRPGLGWTLSPRPTPTPTL
jgi:hypothetical protein